MLLSSISAAFFCLYEHLYAPLINQAKFEAQLPPENSTYMPSLFKVPPIFREYIPPIKFATFDSSGNAAPLNFIV